MDFLLLQFANLLSLMDPVVPTRYVQCVTAHEVTYISLLLCWRCCGVLSAVCLSPCTVHILMWVKAWLYSRLFHLLISDKWRLCSVRFVCAWNDVTYDISPWWWRE